MKRIEARLRESFAERYGDAADAEIALAPGRINLIGEHTDYNGGFVLPMAIDRYVGVAFRVRDDDRVQVTAPDFGDQISFLLSELSPGGPAGWTSYVAGMLWVLQRSGATLRGMDIVLQGELPIGAGLSSSAAVEMAIARAACAASELSWNPVRMAELGQQAEREYVGVSCGIMDQLSVALSAAGCALLIDCRSIETQVVRIPDELQFVVLDTGIRRTLGATAYNERVAQCQAALEAIGQAYPEVRSLREATTGMLHELAGRVDPLLLRRARHVVEENERPSRLVQAFQAEDLAGVGRLMNASHISLRDLFEASCPELDSMVDLATAHSACFGARLTGAGFGGCAIAAVDRERVCDFTEAVATAYRDRFDRSAFLFACNAAPGARLVASGALTHTE